LGMMTGLIENYNDRSMYVFWMVNMAPIAMMN
jgi:hypothetical protein